MGFSEKCIWRRVGVSLPCSIALEQAVVTFSLRALFETQAKEKNWLAGGPLLVLHVGGSGVIEQSYSASFHSGFCFILVSSDVFCYFVITLNRKSH